MDAQKLLGLIKANEKASKFNLSRWFSECGTYGCLVGNDYLANRDERPMLRLCDGFMDHHTICKEYDITKPEVRFLFSAVNTRHVNTWLLRRYRARVITISTRPAYNRDAAINRVRKFVYYKLRKKEIMASDDARYVEGDWNLVGETLCSIGAN